MDDFSRPVPQGPDPLDRDDESATQHLQRATDYVEPEDRPAAWAEMAADLHRRHVPIAQIAEQLCVDKATAERLLALAEVSRG